MYSGFEFKLIYFFYGLAFFSMGLAALLQSKYRESDFPLIKVIHYLGLFGIAHAGVEWLHLVVIGDFFQVRFIFLIAPLNALSFLFLFLFGIKLYNLSFHDKGKLLYLSVIPKVVFSLWLMYYLYILIFHGIFEPEPYAFLNNMARYFIGFPAGIFSAIAVFKNIKFISKIKLYTSDSKIITRYFKAFGIVLGLYGLLTGLIVRKAGYFPASLLNTESFYNITGIHVQVARAASAIIITFIFLKIINIFKLETDFKLKEMAEKQIAWETRRKMSHELHDKVIQSLFAAGLSIENLSICCENEEFNTEIAEIKSNLNETISDLRLFIDDSFKKDFSVQSLKAKIDELIKKIGHISDHEIEFKHDISSVISDQISSEDLIHTYFIIQEAVNNGIKHSTGDKIEISLITDLTGLKVAVKDNGQGIDEINFDNVGLNSMQQRADTIGADLKIINNSNGLIVKLNLNREDSSNGN